MNRRLFLSCLGLAPVAVASPWTCAGPPSPPLTIPLVKSGRPGEYACTLPNEWHNTPGEWTAFVRGHMARDPYLPAILRMRTQDIEFARVNFT